MTKRQKVDDPKALNDFFKDLWVLELNHVGEDGMVQCYKFEFDHKPDKAEMWRCWSETTGGAGDTLLLRKGWQIVEDYADVAVDPVTGKRVHEDTGDGETVETQ